MVVGQWSPGTSLYGNYWVDRPPLLIGLFQLAYLGGGGAVTLRLMGIAAVMAPWASPRRRPESWRRGPIKLTCGAGATFQVRLPN